jgi:hypothetical protein
MNVDWFMLVDLLVFDRNKEKTEKADKSPVKINVRRRPTNQRS